MRPVRVREGPGIQAPAVSLLSSRFLFSCDQPGGVTGHCSAERREAQRRMLRSEAETNVSSFPTDTNDDENTRVFFTALSRPFRSSIASHLASPTHKRHVSVPPVDVRTCVYLSTDICFRVVCVPDSSNHEDRVSSCICVEACSWTRFLPCFATA